MSDSQVTGRAEIPDRLRLERCLRLPGLGPRILFFSGGSALRQTSRVLKRYTHNSTHVITSFDSGGSSAELRRVFGMPSIGDLRNRLLALADESAQGNPEIYRLFSHRLPADEPRALLEDRFRALLEGADPLLADLPPSMGKLMRTHLHAFADHAAGTGFDLRGASIGNLVLTAGYLESGRRLDSVLRLFSELVGVKGHVLPVSEEDAHLAAVLENRRRIVGQHRFRRAEARIESIELVRSLEEPTSTTVGVHPRIGEALRSADLVCFPMGSYFSSVLANLLPRDMVTTLGTSSAPRVYVPNTGHDPEQGGRSVADCVEVLLDHLELGRRTSRETRGDEPAALGRGAPPSIARATEGGSRRTRLLDFVILDRSDAPYVVPTARERIAGLGIDLIELDLVKDPVSGRIDPERLVQALISLS